MARGAGNREPFIRAISVIRSRKTIRGEEEEAAYGERCLSRFLTFHTDRQFPSIALISRAVGPHEHSHPSSTPARDIITPLYTRDCSPGEYCGLPSRRLMVNVSRRERFYSVRGIYTPAAHEFNRERLFGDGTRARGKCFPCNFVANVHTSSVTVSLQPYDSRNFDTRYDFE